MLTSFQSMDTLTEQDITAAREQLAFFESVRVRPHAWTARPCVLRPGTSVRAIVRHAVLRLHAARCDLGDRGPQLVIRLLYQRPIGIHPIGRFAFAAV